MKRARTPLKTGRRRFFFALSAFLSLGSLQAALAVADGSTPGAVAHVSLGLVAGSFSSSNSAAKGSFTVPTAIDLQYELLQSPLSSLNFHFTLVDDLSIDRTDYFYVGVGKKYYFLSNGGAAHVSEGGFSATLAPVWRFYAGAEAGVSDVTTNTLGLYETKSTLFEVGGSAGAIYQISGTWGLEAQTGLSLGYGFTTISVAGWVYRLMLGAAIYF